jgi:hypothetical protein
VELQGRLKEIRGAGYGLAAISYDPVPVLAEFASRRAITYPLLSDAGSKVIRAYGILNTTVPASNAQQRGIPFPGTFIVDRRGVVTSRVFEEAYQERDTVSSVLVRLGHELDRVGTKVATAHLELTTYLSDETVAPGTHFSVVLDVAPRPGIHVYAPGVQGYKPLRLTIEAPAGVLLRDAHFPPSEIFHFRPLDERVPVFRKPFRVVQDLAIDASRGAAEALGAAASLTIRGTLEYQACDDKVCFLSQSVPLAWRVALRPLDRERPAR